MTPACSARDLKLAYPHTVILLYTVSIFGTVQGISMLVIEKVDTENRSQVKRFVEFYYELYKGCPQLVAPLFMDAYLPLNRKKHPFF